MLQGTGLPSNIPALAGQTYTFHQSKCQYCFTNRTFRLLLHLLSRGDNGSKPYGYEFTTTLVPLKEKKQLWIFFLDDKIITLFEKNSFRSPSRVNISFILTSMTRSTVYSAPHANPPFEQNFFSLSFSQGEREKLLLEWDVS
jgi:hypothetical protein